MANKILITFGTDSMLQLMPPYNATLHACVVYAVHRHLLQSSSPLHPSTSIFYQHYSSSLLMTCPYHFNLQFLWYLPHFPCPSNPSVPYSIQLCDSTRFTLHTSIWTSSFPLHPTSLALVALSHASVLVSLPSCIIYSWFSNWFGHKEPRYCQL